ncbi:SURF1 family protein [Nitriliruptoraceae bacterium ZYF776]|nr:SURF1 family protein [Profundirhabdus halotolerans]
MAVAVVDAAHGTPPGRRRGTLPASVPSPMMLRTLLRPAAVVSHLLVLAVVVTCVVLGQWQLDRRGEARELNQRYEQRLAAEPVDVAELREDPDGIDDAALEYRRVTVTGRFVAEDQVLQRNRSFQGQTGFDLLTPLEYAPDRTVLVRRGWIPSGQERPPVDQAPPPDGEVTVSGFLERSVPQPDFGARDAAEGPLTTVFHADVDRLSEQLPGEVFPMVVHLEQPAPDTADALPRPQPAPEFDEANHLSYAVQWHSFALIALVGYVFWWRGRLRGRPGPSPDAVEPRAEEPVA